MNAEDGSKADNVQKSEVTENCWAVDISSSAPDPKDMTGGARRMKQPRQSLHTFLMTA